MRSSTTRLDRHDLKSVTKTCAVCGSRLSAYNAGPTCWAHTPEVPWNGPSTRPR